MAKKTLDQSFAETGRQNIRDFIGGVPGGMDKANRAYQAGTLPQFKNVEEARAWLNGAQQTAISSMSGGNNGATGSLPTPSQLMQSVSGLMNAQAPERPNLLETFTKLRQEQGVADLEQQLNDLKAQDEEIAATIRQRRTLERGKPVAQNVIEGRISTAERQESERADYVRRQIQTKVDQLNTSYNVISTIMDFTRADYELAKDEYDSKFSQAMQVTELMRGLRRDEMNEMEYAQSTARANLQIATNAIYSGNLRYEDLSPQQKTEITKMEVQAGLPPGFVSNLKLNPKDQVVFTTSNEGVTQVGIRNPDGTISVQSYGQRISGSSDSSKSKALQSEMSEYLEFYSNDYGHVTPDIYNKARRMWINEGGDDTVFDERFRVYRDPYRTDNAYDLAGEAREDEFSRQ